ncbi:MAG: phosphoribosylformylglycinamidine synthase subunit PurL [Anaerolineales bacterium]|nr:phosphoribosylformylglycinamidine synthase subunit PurL [Anaerolineales bacterium]
MSIYKFIIQTKRDTREAGYLKDAHALGFQRLKNVTVQDLYFIEGQLSQAGLQELALKLFTDPVTQSAEWDELPAPPSPPQPDSVILEVSLRPGVTDSVAEQIVRAAHEIGIHGVRRVATGQRFILQFDSSVSIRESVTESVDKKSVSIRESVSESADDIIRLSASLSANLLANNVIQHWTIGAIEPSFPEEVESSGAVEIIPIRELSEAELLSLSKERRAALDLAEMKAIQNYFIAEKRDPTDVEFETIAQTWSEHCVHKTFKAKITLTPSPLPEGEGRRGEGEIDSLIKTYLKSATDKIAAPWVISAFVDNAGIIDFDDEYEISFKAETHNHPSAIEPFGGANTGVGGVIRDVLGVSAKPIANTDVLCFGPQDLDPTTLPDGVLHPRRIQSGVVAGVQDYGNKIGIPTVNGAILYDEGYTANPLVFCGCVGIAPKGKHKKNPQVGDRVVILGGRTGRDGLRGATFSSMTMDAQTGEVAGASVQIGDPITEKGLIDVIVRARDLNLYNDITDCGAGGLSSAVGEMASSIGCDVDLTKVRLKYAGLAPWEIWLSEAQERMVVAVAPEKISALQKLCDTFNTELTDIGSFTGNGALIVRYGEKTVVNMNNEFLHDGIPQRQLKAIIEKPTFDNRTFESRISNIQEHLLSLLSSPNVASKSSVIRIYDHEVQGGTVIKPLTGVEMDAPSDAAVIKPIGTKGVKGIALSNGINPELGKRDAYQMAWSVIDEAIRNAVAVGADPERIAILDNFCWGDPLRPETLGSLVEACRGCHDAALFYQTPFISGKDSLNNEYLGADGLRHAIPPTLLISAIGIVPDINKAISMDLKEANNLIYLIGDFKSVFIRESVSESVYKSVSIRESVSPSVPKSALQVYKALHQTINNGYVKSAHDLSEGGLAIAIAEMCIGGRLGAEINFETSDLFNEVNGCLLVEIRPTDAPAFEKQFANLPLNKIGQVTENPILKLSDTEIPVKELVHAFNPQN